jgi:hypothetical protein
MELEDNISEKNGCQPERSRRLVEGCFIAKSQLIHGSTPLTMTSLIGLEGI